MKLLAMDSALDGCSVAVLDGPRLLAHGRREEARGQAEALMPLVQAVMAEAGLGFAALDALAVTIGPGTFTGIRIALAAARGMAVALRLPLVGISTLEALAAGIPQELAEANLRVAAIDARRGEVYVQGFDAAMRPVDEAALLPLGVAAGRLPAGPLVLAGSGAPLLLALLGSDRARLAPGDGRIDARQVAFRALARPLPPAGAAPEPLYLRAPDAKLPGTA
ncbi:MAG: tRNA (adenosine(37)-N6)-threonylcarbamoyltransferase complex dimerization subunit type 1 TsaB [Alphaproteobacteria bacterium]|nr:tRNA (adenosine(37)-N6)-threonylcarbamoyltransferase complex dimerization subunit type 1 TsaB [Alphaproteobacteria bacterium]